MARKAIRAGKALPIKSVTRRGRTAKKGWREKQAERQRRAMELRKAGGSFKAIGAALKCSAMQAHRDVMGALKETLEQTAEQARELRALELARLDQLLTFVWAAASRGSCEHVRAAVRIAERRARLLGLDAQVQAKLELSGQVVNVQAESDLAQLSDAALAERLATLSKTLMALAPASPPKPEPYQLPKNLDEHELALEANKQAYRRHLQERSAAEKAAGNGS